MKLKTVTLITIIGLTAAFVSYLIQRSLGPSIDRSLLMNLSLASNILLYGSLLFFFINIYRRS